MKAISRVPIIAIMLCLLFTGCEFEVTTANISDVKLCARLTGDICSEDNPVFSPNESQFYVSCELKNAPENTYVTFVWKYVEGSPIVIDEVTLNSSHYGINVNLKSSLSRPNNGWPTGKYEVVIMVGKNDKAPHVKTFEVR